jgi:hypothetical protein
MDDVRSVNTGRWGLHALAAVAALAFGLALLAAMPHSSRGQDDAVKQVLDSTRQTVQGTTGTVHSVLAPQRASRGSSGAGSGAGSRASSGSGESPHGQGSVGSVDLNPSSTSTGGGTGSLGDGDEVVIGRSRGERRPDGSHHGHVTIVSLLGHELFGTDTAPGQSSAGPFAGVQELLGQLCTGFGGRLCLGLLNADSTTTQNTSSNSYSTATLAAGGNDGAQVDVAQSSGDFASTGSCQTAAASSRLAAAKLAGEQIADVGESSTSSTSCPGAPGAQQRDSSLLTLFGTEVPAPLNGCENGTPNSGISLAEAVAATCNADGSDAGPTAPASRDALGVSALPASSGPAASLRAAGAESAAVSADGAGTGTPSTPTSSTPSGVDPAASNPAGTSDPAGSSDDTTGTGTDDTGSGAGSGRGAGADAADQTGTAGDSATGRLPFTGTDVLSVLIVGLLALAAGVAIRRRTGAQQSA